MTGKIFLSDEILFKSGSLISLIFQKADIQTESG